MQPILKDKCTFLNSISCSFYGNILGNVLGGSFLKIKGRWVPIMLLPHLVELDIPNSLSYQSGYQSQLATCDSVNWRCQGFQIFCIQCMHGTLKLGPLTPSANLSQGFTCPDFALLPGKPHWHCLQNPEPFGCVKMTDAWKRKEGLEVEKSATALPPKGGNIPRELARWDAKVLSCIALLGLQVANLQLAFLSPPSPWNHFPARWQACRNSWHLRWHAKCYPTLCARLCSSCSPDWKRKGGWSRSQNMEDCGGLEAQKCSSLAQGRL